MGVHAIDTARFLLGDPEPLEVCAVVGARYANGRYAVDDDAVLRSAGRAARIPSWNPADGTRTFPAWSPTPRVYGTGGYARIWEFTEGPPGYEHCAQAMYSAQMREFVDAAIEGQAPRPGPGDGLVVMRIVDEAYRSRATYW